MYHYKNNAQPYLPYHGMRKGNYLHTSELAQPITGPEWTPWSSNEYKGSYPSRHHFFNRRRKYLDGGAANCYANSCMPCGSDIGPTSNVFYSPWSTCGSDLTGCSNVWPGCCSPGCERSPVWPS